jgi:hypothetical protein
MPSCNQSSIFELERVSKFPSCIQPLVAVCIDTWQQPLRSMRSYGAGGGSVLRQTMTGRRLLMMLCGALFLAPSPRNSSGWSVSVWNQVLFFTFEHPLSEKGAKGLSSRLRISDTSTKTISVDFILFHLGITVSTTHSTSTLVRVL